MKLDPVDKASCIGGEEECGARQLFRSSETACGDQGSHVIFECRLLGLRYAQLGEDFGLDLSRAQDGDADPPRLELDRPKSDVPVSTGRKYLPVLSIIHTCPTR